MKSDKPSKESFLKMLNPASSEPEPVVETAAVPTNTWKMLLIEGTNLREVEFEDGDRIGGSVQIRQLNNPADPGTSTPASPGGFSLEQATTATAAAAAAPYVPPKDDGPQGP